MDVKTTFLNGYLKEEIYMEQSKGFVVEVDSHKVCNLIGLFTDLSMSLTIGIFIMMKLLKVLIS